MAGRSIRSEARRAAGGGTICRFGIGPRGRCASASASASASQHVILRVTRPRQDGDALSAHWSLVAVVACFLEPSGSRLA
ncbi:hypothetical protein GUJ93_ZPchr0010g9897 [Zizania palustris]|uniref:Uncharacterized protein n=1 Tax=Zizania palustris TaxID=103762 RepID=A0A8J5W9L5_ZIZPA|nr:hypothetical protein GUJ93_ZPchr0010g9897 [Zizania palustris]